MATQIGIVKEVLGSVVAVDELGNQRILNSGDQLFLGEVVKTLTSTSKAVISMDNDKDVVVLGDDSIKFDKSVTETTSFGSDSAVSANDLQKAILSGADLTQLEATAAGGAPAAGGDGGVAQLNPGIFTQGGSISNVNADIRELGTLNSASIDPLTTVGGAAPAAANVTPPAAPTILTIDGKNPVDSTNDTTPDIVVNVDSGTTPRLVDNAGNTIPSTIVDNGNGTFTITPSAPIDNVNNINVIAVDSAGNSSSATPVNPNIDTTPPAVTITEVTPVDTDAKADGEANKAKITFTSDEPNAPYEIKVGDEVIASGTTPATPNTPIVVEIDTDKVQSNTPVKVEVTDKAGNKGENEKNADTLTFTDTTPPAVTITEVTPVDTDSPADGIPNKVLVSGTSNEPNAPIVLKDKDGNEIAKGTTDENGNFTFEISTDKVNPKDQVKVEVTDKAGNKAEDTKEANDIKFDDTKEPSIEIISAIPVDTDTQADGVANKAKITFTSDEPNAPYEIKVGDEVIASGTTPATPNTSIEVEVITDKVQPNTPVKVEVTDKAGNKGNNEKPADPLSFEDTTAPEVSIDSIIPVDTNEKADGVADKAIVEGTSNEPNAPIVLKDKDGNEIAKGTTDENGKFKLEVPADKIGTDKPITAEVTDKAGNTGKDESTADDIKPIKFDDNTAPDAPEVVSIDGKDPSSPTKDTTPDIVVKVEDGSTPKLVDKDGVEIPATIVDNKDGTFTITPNDPIIDPNNVNVVTEDKAGNVSEKTPVNVNIDTTAPHAPEVAFIGDVDDNGFLNTLDKDFLNSVKPDVKDAFDTLSNLVLVTIPTGVTLGDRLFVTIDVDGKETNYELTMKEEGGAKIFASEDGNTKFPVIPFEDGGDHEVTVIQNTDIINGTKATAKAHFVDKAGNVGAEGTDIMTIDTTAPEVDVIEVNLIDTNNPADGLHDKAEVIFTSNEPNAPYEIKIGDLVIATGVTPNIPNTEIKVEITDPDKVSKLEPRTPVTVEIIDKTGNKAEDTEDASYVKFIDTTPPAAVETIRFVDDIANVDNKNSDGYINEKEAAFINNNNKTKLSVEIALSTTDRPEAGDKLVITDKNGDKLIEHSLTQQEVDSGKVRIDDLVPMADGQESSVSVKVVDKAGNESEHKEAKITVDLTNFVTIDTIEVRDTDASSDGKADQVIVTGKTEPGAKVKIYQTNKEDVTDTNGVILLGETTSDDQGNYTFTKNATNGEDFAGINITAVSTDKAGNEAIKFKGTNATDVIKTDKTAPDAPEVVFIGDADDNGILNTLDKDLLNKIKANTSNVPEAFDVLSNLLLVSVPTDIVVGDKLFVTIDVDGKETNYKLTMKEENGIKFFAGENDTDKFPVHLIEENGNKQAIVIQNLDISNGTKATAKAHFVDQAGNKGMEGSDSITIDTTPPEVNITIDPIDVDDVINFNDLDKPTIPVTGTITGEFTPGDKVAVEVNGKTYETSVNNEGKFSVDVPTSELAQDQDTRITATITATDKAGNETTATAEKDYVIQTDVALTLNAPESVLEGGELNYTLELEQPLKTDLVVNVEVGSTTHSITIPAGQTSANLVVDSKTLRADDVYIQEDTRVEAKILSHNGVDNVKFDTEPKVSIISDDIDPTKVTIDYVVTTTEVIDVNNVDNTDSVKIKAYKVGENGALIESTITKISGTDHDGFGVEGFTPRLNNDGSYTQGKGDNVVTSDAQKELGYDIHKKASEKIVMEFDSPAKSIDVSFAWRSNDEVARVDFFADKEGNTKVGYALVKGGGDNTKAVVEYYNERDELVKTEQVDGGTDRVDLTYKFEPSQGREFTRAEFTASPGTNEKDSDYLINSVKYKSITINKDGTITKEIPESKIEVSEVVIDIKTSNAPQQGHPATAVVEVKGTTYEVKLDAEGHGKLVLPVKGNEVLDAKVIEIKGGNFEAVDVSEAVIKSGIISNETNDTTDNTTPSTPDAGSEEPRDTTPPVAVETIRFVDDKGVVNNVNGDGYINGKENDFLHNEGKTKLSVEIALSTTDRPEAGDKLVIINQKDGSTLVEHILTQDEVDSAKVSISDLVPIVDGEDSYVRVKVVDKAGNEGEYKEAKVAIDLTNSITIDTLEVRDTDASSDGRADQVMVSGTTNPGAKVKIYQTNKSAETEADQVVLLGEVTADDQGNYTFTKDAENGEDFAGINITAVSTDKAGNEVNTSKNTNPSDVIKTDKTAPDAPEIVFPEDTNKNGTLNIAENGETRTETPVVVKVPENAKVGDTLSVTINGTAPVVVTITDDIKANGYQTTAHVAEQTGSISVTATITDKANNTSEAGTGTLNVDISAPVVTISEVTPQDNVGVVDGRADSVRIKGKTLDPNQEVTLKAADGTIIGTITSDNEGNFDTTITTDKVQPGTKVTAESVDPAGNTYSSTATAGSLTNLPAPDIIFTDDQGNPKDNILTNTEVNQNSKTNAQIILPEGVKVGDVLNIKFDTTRDGQKLNWNDAKNQSITLTENDVNSKVVTINTISTYHNVDVAIKASIDRGETKGAEANKSIHSDFSINAPEVSFKYAGDDNILNANEEKQDSADNQTTILVKIPENVAGKDVLKIVVNGNETISQEINPDNAGKTLEFKVPVENQGNLEVKSYVSGYKGATSPESAPAVISVDTIAPEISEVAITQIDTSNPRDNAADKSKVVLKVNDPSVTADNIVVKNAADLPADSIRPVPNEPGKFEATFNTPLVAGSKITITATDPAGNVGTTDDSTNGIVVPDGVSVHEFREKPETPTISFVNDVNNDGNLNIAEEAKDQSGKTTLEIGIPSGLSSTDRVMVEVTKNDGQPQTLQYTLNGRESQNSFRVTDVNVANGDRISVKAYIINNQGARSDYSAVDSINVDLSAPSATITLNNISGDNVIGKNEVNGSVNVSGSVGGDVKASDVVTITLPNGEKVTTQVLDNKTFSVDVAGSKFNGSNGVTAEVKTIDAAGNESPVASTSKSVSIDTTAPNPPSVSFVDQGSDNVLNKAENLKDGDAETTKVVVRANNPQEGDVLVITYTNPKTGEQESKEAPVNSNGEAEFSVPVVHGTPVAVEAVTKDVNGNVSESANASMNVDLKAGIYLETIGYVQQTTNVAGRPSGKRQIKFKVDDIEDDRPVKVEFIGQGGLNSIPGYKTGSHHVVNAKVINGEVVLDYIAGGYGVTYGRGHTNPNLNNFTIKVSTSDNAGNTDSKTYVVRNGMLQNPDVKTPKITEVSDDVYGGKVGALNKGDKTNDSTPTIKGEAVAGKVVEIYDGNTLLGTTTANAQGKFEFVPGLLPDGRHNFTAKVVDGSLKSASSTAFNVNVDTKAGISINAAASTKEGANFVKQITGSVTDVEDGQVVTIFDAANNKTITAVVQGGKYSAKINYGTTEPEAGDIVASVKDVAGNFVSVDVTTTAGQANVATTATNVTYQDYNGSSEAGFKGQLWANTLPGATDELRDSQNRPVSTGRGEMTGRGIETLGEKYSKNYQADIEFNQNAVKFDNPRGLTGFSGVVESTKAIDSDGNILVRPTATEPTFGGSKVLGNIMGGRGGKAGRQTDKDYVDQNGKKLTEGSFGEFVKYTGNVYVKGGTNELFVSAPAGGTNVRIVINGTEVLNYSNGASTNQAFPIRNLDMTKEGFYKVEVMMSMRHAAYKELHKAGDFSVGLVGKNGHFVAFGDTGHGIETKAFTNMDIPQDAIYQDGKIKIPTTTEVSSEESIKVTSAENDTSNKVEFVGTNNNDTIKTTEKPDFIDGKGGADTIIAGAGDDRIVFDVNDVKVDGGTGVDTLVIKADETILSSKPAVVVNYKDYTPTGESGFKGEFWAVQLNGSTTMTKDQNNMTTHSPGQSTGTGIKAQGELFSEHNQTPEVLFNQNSVRFDNLNGLTGLSGVVESIKQLDSDRHVATPFGSQAPTVGGSAGLAQALGGNRQTSVEYLDRNGKPVKAGQMGEFVKYTGNVYVKGGTNEIFVQAPAGGTHINVRINGQEVLGYNSNSSVSNTFRIDTSKTGIDLTKDGFYKVEVSMSMQNKAYENLHGSGDFSTGIVKNGHFVAFGESGHGVETKAFTDMSIPANAIYENGKVKVPVVTEVSGEEVAIKTTETIDFSQISNLDSKVENIEQIDLTGQNTTIKLNPKDVLDMTDNSETILKILGDSGDTVQADSNNWTKSADQSGVDNGFVKYEGTYEGQTIQIQINEDIKTDF